MFYDKSDPQTMATVLGVICVTLFDKYRMTPAEVSRLFCLKHTKGAEIILSRVGGTRERGLSRAQRSSAGDRPEAPEPNEQKPGIEREITTPTGEAS
jgi:hypothetical protein